MKRKCFGFILLFVIAGSSYALAATGAAVIKPTKEGSNLSGNVSLTDTPGGLKVSVDLKGVSPGKHGFHIHEIGACTEESKAAGGHYNPDGVPHGLLSKDGFSHAHAGDLGNIEINPDGSGKLEAVLPGLTLTGGKYNVAGRAFILHEKADEFSQPTGNAGGRIGCGVIEVSNS